LTLVFPSFLAPRWSPGRGDTPVTPGRTGPPLHRARWPVCWPSPTGTSMKRATCWPTRRSSSGSTPKAGPRLPPPSAGHRRWTRWGRSPTRRTTSSSRPP